MSRIDDLLNTPYWIIDILPMQVPKDGPGQYFKIEKLFLTEQLADIKLKHVNVILKLNCYMDISIDEEVNPSPEQIRNIINQRYVFIMMGDSMILSEPDDTHMTVFNPDEKLLDLIKIISRGGKGCMSGSRKIQCDEVLKCIKKIYRQNGNEVQTCLKNWM